MGDSVWLAATGTMRAGVIVFAGLLAVAYCLPMPQGGGGHHQPQGFFQYVNVPAHKEYEFGWNRGNEHHYISRFEQSKDHRFRTRVKWGDKDGYGEHYWEYNHGPKHKDEYKEPVYHKPEPVYHSPPKKGYASENVEVVYAPESYIPEQDLVYVSDASENIEQVVAPPEFSEFYIPEGYELVKIQDFQKD